MQAMTALDRTAHHRGRKIAGNKVYNTVHEMMIAVNIITFSIQTIAVEIGNTYCELDYSISNTYPCYTKNDSRPVKGNTKQKL